MGRLWIIFCTAVFISINILPTVHGEIWQGSVKISEDFVLEEGDTLLIEPGTEILLSDGIQMEILGDLTAVGTENSTIRFRTIGDGQQWDGLIFTPSSYASGYLKFVEIEQARRAITVDGSNPHLSDVYLHDNEGGLFVTGPSTMTIENSLFSKNSWGITGNWGADIQIVNVTISQTTTDAIHMVGSSPVVRDSVILDSGRYDLRATDSSVIILRNTTLDESRIRVEGSNTRVDLDGRILRGHEPTPGFEAASLLLILLITVLWKRKRWFRS